MARGILLMYSWAAAVGLTVHNAWDTGVKKFCEDCTPIFGFKSVPPTPVNQFSQEEEEDRKNCACMNWKTLFKTEKMACGMGGYEMRVNDTKGKDPDHREEYERKKEKCNAFYKKMDTSMCLNKHMGGVEGQFCYVSLRCKRWYEDQIGHKVQGVDRHTFVVKDCLAENGDRLSSDMSPRKLKDFANKNGMSVSTLAQLAYSEVKDHKWQDVKPFFFKSEKWNKAEHKGEHNFTADQLDTLEEIVLSRKPVRWTSGTSGQYPFGLTLGMQAYEVDETLLKWPRLGKKSAQMKCLNHCGQSEAESDSF